MSSREDSERKSRNEQRGADSASSLSNFVFNHKSTEKWKLLRTCLAEEFMQEAISHIMYPEQMEDMKKPLEPARILPEPADETAEQRTIRLAQQQLINTDWLEASKEQRRRSGDKLRKECQIGMGILLKHVDYNIKNDLQELLDKPENARKDSEERWYMVWSRLESEWGPSTHYDVQILQEKLRTLDGNKMTKAGWLGYWSKFKEIVSALEQIELKDENGNVVRGPLPALPEVELPKPAADNTRPERKRYKSACKKYVQAVRLNTAERDRKYPLGGPILNHRPTDEELKTILMNALEKCNIASIRQYYNSLLEIKNKTIPFETIFGEVRNLALTEDRATGAKRTFDQARDKFPQSRRSEPSAAQVKAFIASMSQSSEPKQPNRRPCANCKSTKHGTRQCDSTKCGTCDKTFGSAIERQAHWDREHKDKQQQPRGGTQRNGKDPNKPRQLKTTKESRANVAKAEPKRKRLRFADESSAADSEADDDDDDDYRVSTDDDFDPNSA
jgi:hypothetical protein